MALASGFTAIEQRKEVAEIFEGNSLKYITYYARKIDQAKQATVGQDENSAFLLFMFIVTKRRFWNI